MDALREKVTKLLDEHTNYPVGVGRKKTVGQIQYDMVSNYKGNMHVSKFSLTKEGLKVLPLKSFNLKHYSL